MRIRRPVLLSITGAIAIAALAGCSTPAPSPTPTPKATPLYSSDAEALAAAQKAYAKYVDVSNQVAHDGWKDLTPLKTVATGDALKADEKSGRENRAHGLNAVGDATGEVKSIERNGVDSLIVYACFDVSATTIRDRAGIDVTSPSRKTVVPFEVRLVPARARLLVGRMDVWTSDTFC